MKMKIKFYSDNVTFPKRSYSTDGGLDLYMPCEGTIAPHTTEVYGLGLGVQIPEGYTAMIVPRSSIAKKGLILQTQLIDCGYTGEIHMIVTNSNNIPYSFNKDDRLGSLLIIPCLSPELEVVDEFEATERGSKGLGSTKA